MALGGFDFLAAEKDTSKKIEELAQVLERVATIFLNGVGSLEKQLEEMRNRIAKVETQVDTLLRMGGTTKVPMSPSAGPISGPEDVEPTTPPSPGLPPPSPPAEPGAAPGVGVPPPTPTSPMGAAASGGLGIRAQMQGELRSFLARRRAALEASLEKDK